MGSKSRRSSGCWNPCGSYGGGGSGSSKSKKSRKSGSGSSCY
jgi:hypothetical protein